MKLENVVGPYVTPVLVREVDIGRCLCHALAIKLSCRLLPHDRSEAVAPDFCHLVPEKMLCEYLYKFIEVNQFKKNILPDYSE